MAKPDPSTGKKNLIGKQVIQLRKKHHLSQHSLAQKLQLAGYDMDKNIITRIENNQRYVSDFELKAFTEIFQVSYEYLLDGIDETSEKA